MATAAILDDVGSGGHGQAERQRAGILRPVLVVTVLGSGVAFLDGTVVNVALPSIARSLHTGFSTLEWVLDAYLLGLASLVLVGGALGDSFGRRRVFLVGLVGFAVTSALCAVAPTGGVLIAARGLQGVAAAVLTPTSLALLSASYDEADRARAVGAWSGLGSLASALGPFVGGYLVDTASWRWVFLLNLPLVATAVVVTLRWVPEPVAADVEPSRPVACEPHRPLHERLDLPGAVLGATALALLTLPLIETRLAVGIRGGLFLAAAVAGAGWVAAEHWQRHPMVPLQVFRNRTFTAAQVVTVTVYAALSGALFLLSVELQTGLGYSALAAGAASVPATVMLLLFSSRVAGLIPRIGARALLTVGPVVTAAGFLLMRRVGPGASYPGAVLPALLVFAAGMCLTVSPVTATAIGALDQAQAGIASGINNAVARIGGLVAVAVLPVIAGGSGAAHLPAGGFRTAMTVAAVVAAAGGVAAFVGLPPRAGAAPGGPAGDGDGDRRGHPVADPPTVDSVPR